MLDEGCQKLKIAENTRNHNPWLFTHIRLLPVQSTSSAHQLCSRRVANLELSQYQNIQTHDTAFFTVRALPALKTLQNATRRIPARAHVFRRSSQPPKSLAPRKYRRILKTTSAKHRFHRSSGAFRLPPPKTFPELLARFSRTTAKNGHRTQAKRHFLHTRYHHFLKRGVRAPVRVANSRNRPEAKVPRTSYFTMDPDSRTEVASNGATAPAT